MQSASGLLFNIDLSKHLFNISSSRSCSLSSTWYRSASRMDYSIVLGKLKCPRKVEKGVITSHCNRTFSYGAPNPKGQPHYNGSWKWGVLTFTWQHPFQDLKATVSLPKKNYCQKETPQRDTLVMKKKMKKSIVQRKLLHVFIFGPRSPSQQVLHYMHCLKSQ